MSTYLQETSTKLNQVGVLLVSETNSIIINVLIFIGKAVTIAHFL